MTRQMRRAARSRPAFAGFFERDAIRRERRRHKRRVIVFSILLHVAVVVAAVVWSVWDVDELEGPYVGVSFMPLPPAQGEATPERRPAGATPASAENKSPPAVGKRGSPP